MPRLTEYLLKLGTDPRELDRYKEARKEKRLQAYLTKSPGPGLTPEQARALQSGKSHRVFKAAVAELSKETSTKSDAFLGVGITFTCEVNNIER